jgi:transcriptional regulator with XRE-family HTH domain
MLVMSISLEQLRAARGLLGWSQAELAERAGLSVPTIKRLEGGFGPRVSDAARDRLQMAIEAAGVEFIEENGGGLGVRFRRKGKRKSTEDSWASMWTTFSTTAELDFKITGEILGLDLAMLFAPGARERRGTKGG